MGGISRIKLLSANKGLLKKAEHNPTTYSSHQELTQKNIISKVHFFVRHPVYVHSKVRSIDQKIEMLSLVGLAS